MNRQFSPYLPYDGAVRRSMDASHSVCYNVDDLIFSKNKIYFVLENKLLPGSNLASSGLKKMFI